MEDKKDILRDRQPFSWQILKNDKAFIFWKGKNIKTLTGRDFVKLMMILEADDSYNIQLFLAKITGHFKH